ncbi:MAG: hypothetical protein KR126chlam6_01389 [Candidatus Anoxychlamydiales bacterium]|nr:hypothetical protein [Candidatus Anoxychlamydiales bacterium]
MPQDKPEILSQLVKISIYSLPAFFLILAWIYTFLRKKQIKISQNKLRVGSWFFLLYLLIQTIFFQGLSLKMTGDVYLPSKGVPFIILSGGIIVSYISIILMFFKSRKLDLQQTKNFQLILSRIALSAIPISISALFLIVFFIMH